MNVFILSKLLLEKQIKIIVQFENKLKEVWNSSRLTINYGYVITLDRIYERSMSVLDRILKHPYFPEQVKEWQDLGMVDSSFAADALWETDLMGRHLHPRYRFLPLDTCYFKDLEPEILALFDNLDEALDGWLVKSENYQALQTMLPKFRERVKCIYIDPPYNSPESEVHYVNQFSHSSWLTLIENRICLAKYFLQKEAALIVAIDDYEFTNLSKLLSILLPEYDLNVFVINHHPQGAIKSNIVRTHEYALILTSKGLDFSKIREPYERLVERPFMRTGAASNNFRSGRPNSFYAITVDTDTGHIVSIEDPPMSENSYPKETDMNNKIYVYPIDSSGKERVWRKTSSSARKMLENGLLFAKKGKKGYTIFEKSFINYRKPVSNWIDKRYNAGPHGTKLLINLLGANNFFPYPKSIYTIQDLIAITSYKHRNAIVLDFFAGSGTTAHAVINLNREDNGRRKYILVEMADYFYTVLLPRIKKVVFSDKWKNGKAQPDGRGISHFLKYYELEQYEDAIRRAALFEF